MENKLDLWTSFTSVESNNNSSNDITTQPKQQSSGQRKNAPVKHMPGETIDQYIERAFENIRINLETVVTDNRRPVEED
jgi:ribosomal protein S12